MIGFLKSLVQKLNSMPKTVIFGFPEKKYIAINLTIMLVKRLIFSHSRLTANIAFDNIVKYLQYYYSLEKLMFENIFYQRKLSKWACLFDVVWYAVRPYHG